MIRDQQREVRRQQLQLLWESATPEIHSALEAAALSFRTAFPQEPLGYEAVMFLIEITPPAKAHSLAVGMAQSDAPIGFRQWAEGFLYRLSLVGSPVSLRFECLDGHTVDLEAMHGKVVLVDFWSTECHGCVAGIPLLKNIHAAFHEQGLEIVGLSCDTDKDRLARFVEAHDLAWPQHFEGKGNRTENTMTRRFGVNAIPRIFLVDKKGCLREDNLRLRVAPRLADKVAALLAE